VLFSKNQLLVLLVFFIICLFFYFILDLHFCLLCLGLIFFSQLLEINVILFKMFSSLILKATNHPLSPALAVSTNFGMFQLNCCSIKMFLMSTVTSFLNSELFSILLLTSTHLGVFWLSFWHWFLNYFSCGQRTSYVWFQSLEICWVLVVMVQHVTGLVNVFCGLQNMMSVAVCYRWLLRSSMYSLNLLFAYSTILSRKVC
jgi:hypothetical protein